MGGGASLREGVLAVSCRVDAGHRFDFVWRRWVPSLGLVGSASLWASAAVMREASQGFVLTEQCGSAYLMRSITTTCRCRDRCLRTFSHLGPEFCGRPTPR